MKQRMRALAATCLFVLAAAAASAQTTVRVNCHRGRSINAALAKHKNAVSLVIEVRGMCTENVVIDRGNVTLLGGDPDEDGVQAPPGTEIAVLVRHAGPNPGVALQNLRFTGGSEDGLRVSHSSSRVTNCRGEGNAAGMNVLFGSSSIEDSTFSSNSTHGLGVFGGSLVACLRCTIADNGGGAFSEGVEIGQKSQVNIRDSQLSGSEVGIANGGTLILRNSSLEASDVSLSAGAGTVSFLNTVALSGSLSLHDGAAVHLNGTTQTTNNNENGNAVFSHSSLFLANASALVGPAHVGGFGVMTVGGNSSIAGNLHCGSGGDAFCDAGASVTTSNCGKCPVP
jgi:hypothetical protein